jgi:hypothetical protein
MVDLDPTSALVTARSCRPSVTTHPDVPEAHGANLAFVDRLSLARLQVVALQAAVEIGAPLEEVLHEPLVERPSHRGVAMQPLVFRLPVPENGLRRLLCPPPPVPPCRSLVDAIPAELLDDEPSLRLEQLVHPIEREIQALDVVERVARHHSRERLDVGKLLEERATEDRALRSARVDAEHRVTSLVQRTGQFALAATGVEHTHRGWWKGSRDERDEISGQTPSLSSPRSIRSAATRPARERFVGSAHVRARRPLSRTQKRSR